MPNDFENAILQYAQLKELKQLDKVCYICRKSEPDFDIKLPYADKTIKICKLCYQTIKGE